MRVSPEGVDFLRKNEGSVPSPYNDPIGAATIGVGHLLHLGNVTDYDKQMWGTLTSDQVTDLLKGDLVKYEQAVNGLVDHDLQQQRFDALVDFTFNVGIGALSSSTLLTVINAANYSSKQDDIHSELQRWVHAGGVVIEGMKRRREREWTLWSTGAYT